MTMMMKMIVRDSKEDATECVVPEFVESWSALQSERLVTCWLLVFNVA